jgi:hypothetical protein
MQDIINTITQFLNIAHDNIFNILQAKGFNAYLILGVIGIYIITNSFRRFSLIYSFLMLPSTFLHESMHYVVGKITNAKPVSFSILPKKSNEGLTLGQVGLNNITWYNAFPVAMAPFLLIPIMILINYYYPINKIDTILEFSIVYMTATLLSGGIPSNVDFQIARSYLFMFITYSISTIYLILYFFKENHYIGWFLDRTFRMVEFSINYFF